MSISTVRRKWRFSIVGLFILLGLGLTAGSISASKPTDAADNSPNSPSTNDAYLELVPGDPGNCPAPVNGGTTTVGCRFVLDMMFDAGSNLTILQESYMTFTHSLLQNANVSQIGASCTLTSTFTPDLTTLDSTLQNEICNGPNDCAFRRHTVAPGTVSYTTAVSPISPFAEGYFRVAQIGLCATTPGQAVLHWQFSPPAPSTRHTMILDDNNWEVQNPTLFTDYVINIVPGANDTPTATFTPTNTPAGTNTPVRTNTPNPTRDGFLRLAPQGSAPPNGGSMTVGNRFVLELWINTGSHPDVVAQQSYLTFTNSLLQNARVDQIGAQCTLTSTVTADLTTLELALQNEVCNGPSACIFRGVSVAPGSMAFASGINFTSFPVGGDFRVAQIGLCAVAPGQAVLHWQFTPPDPFTRDTEIVVRDGTLIHNPTLFTDYTINITVPTLTPTPTETPIIAMRGHITWIGPLPQPNQAQVLPVSLTLQLATGGPPYEYPLQNTDANGYFAVSAVGLPNGVYNWRIKGPKSLANAGTLTLTGAPVTQAEMGAMRPGDANNDNMVTIFDFIIHKVTFANSCGNAGYDPRSDFNNDCRANVADFNLLRTNFGTTGAP